VNVPSGGPHLIAVAGPNGAGKSTFYEAFLWPAGLRFVNADTIARDLGLDAYEAAELASVLRSQLIARRESFVFETVLSDPEGAKVEFLRQAAADGYGVVLCFIGLADAALSDERVAMRVMQGGHDVPTEKLVARFPRTRANLSRAIEALPRVLIYDNSDLAAPFRFLAEFENGKLTRAGKPWPQWLEIVVSTH